ncbi:MAG: CatB-related O-acetyltransferase [Beduini sp.]|uniref:CatB-related O-acetyltransferase n=1 Tax=Beduini sp. TaxID=1922300 RepID=UPI0039A1A1D1
MKQEFNEAKFDTYPTYNQHKNMIYIKNTIKASNVHVGMFTYYDCNGKVDADFEKDNVFYNYPGHGDLYIGKFCSIAYGVEFIMGAANHSTRSFSTYPFNTISKNWASHLGMTKDEMPPIKDTIVGNDVWIGRKARIMPGVKIGDGAIIAGYSVVTKDVPPYSVVGGSPAAIIKSRFDEDTIAFLKEIKWWNFESDNLEKAITYLSNVNLKESKKNLEKIYQADIEMKNK